MNNLICFLLAVTLVGVVGCRRGIATPTSSVKVVQITEDSPEERRRKLVEQNRGKDGPTEPTKSPPKSTGPGIIQQLKEPRQITNSIGMKLNYIPPGKFLMGSPTSLHEVELTNGFYMGEYEVTQAEYQAIMGVNPSVYKGAKLPVESVSWNDAQAFCRKLSAKEGKTYRLPTEAEWEYACRAGTATAYHFGHTIEPNLANYDYKHNNKTTQVGSFSPNAWGLHDMHGNVWEWCEGWYDYKYHNNSPKQDPLNNKGGSARVVRGGSFGNSAWFCTASSHRMWGPGDYGAQIGFRVVAVPSNRDTEQSKAGGKSGTG